MPQGFTAEQAAPRHRRIFIAIAGFLLVVAIATFLVANQPLVPLPAFLPSFASAVIVTDLITAYLIFAHAPLARRPALLALAGGYLYSGSIVIGQMLVFPGVWAEHGLLGAGPQSAVWIWVFWHAGFPIFVIAAMILAYRQQEQERLFSMTARTSAKTSICIILLVVLLVALVTQGQGLLPGLIVDGNYHSLAVSAEAQLVIILNVVALAAVLYVTRGKTILDLGLSIAMLASLIDAVLTLRAGTRFSLGWYVARISSAVSAFSVLAVYLGEITWLHARVLRLNAQLEEQVSTDVITKLHNRRYFNRHLNMALRDAKRRREELSLLMIDIDHFKRYNDHYGHQGGDEALRQVAKAIQSAVHRPVDIAARYGGEEFAVILPTTTRAGATHVADSILAAVRALALPHADSPTAAIVTVSIGAATVTGAASPDVIIHLADQALYAAKAQGRNRLVSSDREQEASALMQAAQRTAGE